MSKEEYLNYLLNKQAEKQAEVERLNEEYKKLWQSYHEATTDYDKNNLKVLLWDLYHTIVEKRSELDVLDDEISKVRKDIKENSNNDKIIIEEEKVNEKGHGALLALSITALALATGTAGFVIGQNSNCNGRIVHVQGDEETKTETPTAEVTETPTAKVTETPAPTEEPEVEVKPFESYGNFTDASDPQMLEERANWYFDEYFSKFDKDELEKSGITKESLIDIMSVFNGKLPVTGEMEVNELLNYNNLAVKAFVNFPSSWDRVKKGERIFIPTQYLFEDGSYEQKCAAEVDSLMEVIIKAMNEEDYVTFYNNAVKFEELIRDQYFLVDNNTEHYTVRSIASFPSRIQLYGLAYAQWADNINEFQLSRELDVCADFCFDHETKEMTQIPLAKLMATLEFIPMGEWDAVLQRAGLTTLEIEKMGNSAVGDTMPVVFTRDAKNHFRELIREKEEQKTLNLG